MRKLIEGIIEFRRHVYPAYRTTFARLAGTQDPDCLFVGCSDSRVVPNLFASTDPGDLFVVRNLGNLVPPHGHERGPGSSPSVGAALEFALHALDVADVVVCGHSNCGAMRGLLSGDLPPGAESLSAWLQHGRPALERLSRLPDGEGGIALDASLPEHDRLSQLNVLEQVRHVASYPFVGERVAAGALRLHGWWFDIGTAEVWAYEPEFGRFVRMDEAEAARLKARMGDAGPAPVPEGPAGRA